jgi:hypothetical protein
VERVTSPGSNTFGSHFLPGLAPHVGQRIANVTLDGNAEPKWLPKSGTASPSNYTSTHGSWLNQAEIEIGIFSRQCLGKRRIPDLKTLRREAKAWNRRMNRDRVKIAWKFDRKAARHKFGYKRKSFTRSET